MSIKAIRLAITAALMVVAVGSAPASQAASTNLFAVVDQFGTLLSGGGGASVEYLGIGRYEVTFTSNVSNCAYVATTTNTYTQALNVFTAGGQLSRNGVYVETKNQGGGLTDGAFNLIVSCGSPGTYYAVVGYNGTLVRGSPGLSLIDQGSGRYVLAFPTTVENEQCAYLATVGDPGNGLVFNPSGVYTGHGPTPVVVYIETKNPGGGLQSGIPFHLALICPAAKDVAVALVHPNGFAGRASPVTSTLSTGVGNYLLVTDRNVESCAAVATRGSITRAVPYTPTTVEIVPGLSANSIGIEERQLLGFGGALVDESFHAAIVC
jgi:hypothetical protein